jgi:hypothetical protein
MCQFILFRKEERMSPRKIVEAIGTSVMTSAHGLWSRITGLPSGQTGKCSTAGLDPDEPLKIEELGRSQVRSQSPAEQQPVTAPAEEAFRDCIVKGEQQAECFTLALLFVVFVGIVLSRAGHS